MNLCIIDDHKLVAQGLMNQLLKEQDVKMVSVFYSAEEFLMEKFTDTQPDLVLVDYMMPGMNALDLITLSISKLPKTKFIVLTSLMEPELVKEVFSAGASGYVTKDVTIDELLEAILMALNGGRYISHSMKEKLVHNMFIDEPLSYKLSTRENEVLIQICQGATPKEIAAKMGLSLHTIHHFIRRTMRKMDVNRTIDLVVLAIKNGLYMP
ncbi:response regulator transcription factor [Dyadobacter sp. NIV53]|uniref:response regulator transcription factor n=1 Tax=Dyadobacter sp. NIV53 TaxID=2861765 RepID=UPI001C869EAD|nr:response regulator transcription factor [Dyadobacter sp. NIV53]